MERSKIKKHIQLCGESDGELFLRTFTIKKVIDTGGSVICYEACHDESGRGILKEFYPDNIFALERRADGQLVYDGSSDDNYEKFKVAEKVYLEPYELLLDVKKNKETQELSTFIPNFEIYHGCDENKNIVGTTYIWTPEPQLETFDKICEDIHKHPNVNPEHKMVLILTAIESLTKCICSLHSASLIHRDIKPSNFGFIKRGDDTLMQTLSMFDINSICSVYNVSEGMATPGYMEPEVEYEKANNLTDIYSIGATLYHAIANSVDDKENNYLYKAENYDSLANIIDESALIKASESNSHPRLRKTLTKILQGCLAEREKRYQNCEELLEDIEEAMYYALPSSVAKKMYSGEKWVLADVEKTLDIVKDKNSSLALKYHLYTKPLYTYSNSEDLNVMLVGFGNYGQKFLDICLQIGQMIGKKLNVTIISEDNVDRDIYLSERPSLSKFFNIDCCDKINDSYGNIVFKNISLNRDNYAKNKEILQDLLCDSYGNDSEAIPQYVFIALGEDQLNLSAAKACKEAIEVCETKAVINFACEGTVSEKLEEDIFPVYVNKNAESSELYPEIERMALNVHLVWEKNLNVEYRAIKADFRKPYNHDSCIGNVLSLKYKLYSVGIDLDKCDFKTAAKMFKQIFADKKQKGIKNELIAIEHRRWVVEKICLGWTTISDLNECATGMTKDEKHKRHICIVKSRADQMLATEFKNGSNYDKWDKAEKSEISKLDELDRLSVELHRMYVKRANIVRKQNLLNGNIIAEIKLLIDDNRKSVVAFQEWYTCLKEIWNGDRNKVKLYKGLKNNFIKSLDGIALENKKSVKEQVKAFEAMFYPILASMEYRDYKQDDVKLIDNIPFILTYSEAFYMVIPYLMGDNSKVFSNVAAATVVNPARIIYLAYFTDSQDVKEFTQSIPYLMEYMRKKHFRAAVDFVIAYSDEISAYVDENFKEKIIKEGKGRIRQIKTMPIYSMGELKGKIVDYLSERRKGKRLFAVEVNKSNLVISEFYDGFDTYKFDQLTMKFQALTNCEELCYINKQCFITVNDMIAFKNSSSESSNQPEFFADYKELWAKYRERETGKNTSLTWKLLCEQLGEYSKKNDIIAAFKKKSRQEKTDEAETLRFILPYKCSAAVKRILDFLKENELIESGSNVNGYTSDSCEVIIKDKCGYSSEYAKLFSNPYALMMTSSIDYYLNTKTHEATVVFDNLIVSGIQITGGRASEIMELLEYFAHNDNRYIINLQNNNGTISFTYATKQIKELLTVGGKLLEIYVYHKIKELNQFDDVVSSFEINMEDTDVVNEFDAILTKGFRSFFIECKATPDIQREYYFKLAELARKYGIHGTAVLIADTQEKPFYDSAQNNDKQRKWGESENIITIYKPEEINNIGHTLLKIVNGKYLSE